MQQSDVMIVFLHSSSSISTINTTIIEQLLLFSFLPIVGRAYRRLLVAQTYSRRFLLYCLKSKRSSGTILFASASMLDLLNAFY